MNPSDVLSIHPLLSDRVRLSIMTALSTARKPLTFSELIEMLGLSRGNLSTHMSKLEDEKLITIKKDFIDRKPCTSFICSDKGYKEMKNYLSVVEKIIKNSRKA